MVEVDMVDGSKGVIEAGKGVFAVSPPNDIEQSRNIREAFLSRLYRKHYRELCGRLYRIFGSGPPEPEDTAQAAFAKLTELEGLMEIRQPRAFLFRTAVNIGLNSVERIKVARRFAQSELSAVNEFIVEENTPEDVYYMKQRLEHTQSVFSRLTPKQKEIVIRSRIRGETYAVISKATGWSQAEISRQMKAALIAMQNATGNDKA